MGYLHIQNLYKCQKVLLFKEVYAMEKIHGTSAHISWKNGDLKFFSGGVSHVEFVMLFNAEALKAKLTEIFGLESDTTIYGEAYGGKCQRMSETYGIPLRFTAFDIMSGGHWFTVPAAEMMCMQLGLEFVPYYKVPATVEALDAERDKPSEIAVRRGITKPMPREGIVIRPLIEITINNDCRLIAKHKIAQFCETKTPRIVDENQLAILEKVNEVVDEWVTAERFGHVIDKLKAQMFEAGGGKPELDITDCGKVAVAMVEDVNREGKDEFLGGKEVNRAISRRTIEMFKKHIRHGQMPESAVASE